MLHKVNLDTSSLSEIAHLIQNNQGDIVVFYNPLEWKQLNSKLIFSIILLMKKMKVASYYFYNVPFCLFKKLGKNFINAHCVRNRLCNYYSWYVTHGKCNQCDYGLFCNTFNSEIRGIEIDALEGFYTENLIQKNELLEKIYKLHLFVYSLGYKEDEVSFYITQKFMVDFLLGDMPINNGFLQYFTIYFLVKNPKLSREVFVDIDSFSLVLKKWTAEEKLVRLLKELWINMSFSFGKEYRNTLNIPYKETNMKMDTFHSIEKASEKKPFFDFQEDDLKEEEDSISFVGKVHNPKNIVITTSVSLVHKAGDLYKSDSTIYMGRDIISGVNINNYEWLLLTSDNLWEFWRLAQSLESIHIPIIYDIKPNMLNILKNGDMVRIDFNSWVIQKC